MERPLSHFPHSKEKLKVMRTRRKKLRQNSTSNLDALTDVVSNNVGIFVLLASALSLFMVINHATNTKQKEDTPPQDLMKQILIPWTRPSQKSPVLFLLANQKITYLNRHKALENIAEALENRPQTIGQDSNLQRVYRLDFEKYQIEYSIYSQFTQCFLFEPKPHQSKDTQYLEQQLMEVMKDKNVTSFYAFFWVDSQSLEMFREVRQFLWDQKIQVGWRPINKETEMRYCIGANNGIGFRPQ